MSVTKIAFLAIMLTTTSLGLARLSEGRLKQQSNAADKSGTDPGVRLIASVVKDHFRVGEPIVLKLLLKNVVNEERQLVSGGLKDYQIEIKDTFDKIVPRTAAGEAKKRNEVISIAKGPITLRADEERDEGEISLTDLFDLSTPGKYVINVRHRGPRLDHSLATLNSNKVTITIQ